MAKRRMGLRHIEAFRAVMITGSMTEAARRLRTSQPQISRLISQLESIACFQVFDRNGSRLVPTLDGSRFYQEVEKTFIGLDKLEGAAANIRSFAADRLRVAAMPRLAGGLLTSIVVRFKSRHPEVMVSIHSGTAAAVNEWIKTGLCDIGIAMLYDETTEVRAETVVKAACVAVLPAGHRLAGRRMVAPEDFEGEAFISFLDGNPLRNKIDRLFDERGVARRIIVETDLGASVCALVAAGLGSSLINPMAARDEGERQGIEIRPFEPALPVEIAVLYPPHGTTSRLVAAFGSCARDFLTEAWDAQQV